MYVSSALSRLAKELLKIGFEYKRNAVTRGGHVTVDIMFPSGVQHRFKVEKGEDPFPPPLPPGREPGGKPGV